MNKDVRAVYLLMPNTLEVIKQEWVTNAYKLMPGDVLVYKTHIKHLSI